MADSDVEEKEDESIIPKYLIKWDQKIANNLCSQSSNNGWSMVLIKDNQESSLIFPPVDHEKLHLTPSLPHEKPHHINPLMPPFLSPTSSSLSPLSVENDDDSNDSVSTLFSGSIQQVGPEESPVFSPTQLARPASGLARWVNFGLDVVYSKVRRVFWSFQSSSRAAFTALMLLGFVYFWWRRRVKARQKSRVQLVRMIRERDERINQLLHQIARMNDILLGHKAAESVGTLKRKLD